MSVLHHIPRIIITALFAANTTAAAENLNTTDPVKDFTTANDTKLGRCVAQTFGALKTDENEIFYDAEINVISITTDSRPSADKTDLAATISGTNLDIVSSRYVDGFPVNSSQISILFNENMGGIVYATIKADGADPVDMLDSTSKTLLSTLDCLSVDKGMEIK